MSPKDLYDLRCDPTIYQLMNAVKGHNEDLEFMYKSVFEAARLNAHFTPYTKEQSKYISRHKFPWESDKDRSGMRNERGVLSYDKMRPLFDMISKDKGEA